MSGAELGTRVCSGALPAGGVRIAGEHLHVDPQHPSERVRPILSLACARALSLSFPRSLSLSLPLSLSLSWYAVSGTKLACSAIGLGAWYAKSGTELAYGAWYAKSGTELAYGADWARRATSQSTLTTHAALSRSVLR
eukprot:424136-Rhodomonas_salina.1